LKIHYFIILKNIENSNEGCVWDSGSDSGSKCFSL